MLYPVESALNRTFDGNGNRKNEQFVVCYSHSLLLEGSKIICISSITLLILSQQGDFLDKNKS